MKSFLSIIALLLLLPSADAQVRRNPAKTAKKKTVARKPVPKKQPKVIVADTPVVIVKTPVDITPADTTKVADTMKIEKVVEAIGDSVKAQVKAPIVQIPVRLKSLILPGALFTYGALTLNIQGLRNLNHELKEAVYGDHPHQKREYIENTALFLPAAAVYALNIAGIKGENNLIDRSVLYGMSNAIANGIVFGVKYLGIEQRPDSSNNYSFPSGHAAEAFISAEFLRLEYRHVSKWYGIAGYAVALVTPYMRMYNNKHWFSDVVAGAGVGIASTRFAYYIYPALKKKIFGSKKIKGDAMLFPSYRSGGGYGFTFISTF